MDWKNNLDSIIKSHLDFQLKEVMKQKKAFMQSQNPSKAQLWCAVANLSKLISALNTKIKKLEKQIVLLEKKKSDKKVVKKKSVKKVTKKKVKAISKKKRKRR